MAHYLEIALQGAIKENNTRLVRKFIKEIERSSQLRKSATAEDKAVMAVTADMKAVNDEGRSFLHYALKCAAYASYQILFPYYQEEYELLLSRDKKGKSPFWHAVKRGYEDIAQQLFGYYPSEPGVSVRNTWLQGDEKGATPLHLAAGSSSPFLLSWLLESLDEHDDDIVSLVNLFDENESTPLHYACSRMHRLHMISLLEVGAATHLKNKDKKSFFTFLQKNIDFFNDTGLSAKIKSHIIEDHRKILRDNPDDEELKKFHVQLLSKLNLLETVRSKIEFDCEVVGSLDNVYHETLCSQSEPAGKLYELINKDRALLTSYLDRISKMVGKLRGYNKNPERQHHLATALYWLGGVTSTTGITFELTFLLDWFVNYPGHLVPAIATYLRLPLPALLLVLTLIMTILITFALVGGGLILRDLQCRQLEGEVNKEIPVIKDVLAKLIKLEKTNVNLLPVSAQFIRNIEDRIQLLDQTYNKLTKEFAEELEEIKPIIIELDKEILRKNKPLTRVVKPMPTKIVLSEDEIILDMTDAPKPSARAESAKVSSLPAALFNRGRRNSLHTDTELEALHPSTDEAAPLLDDEDSIKLELGYSSA